MTDWENIELTVEEFAPLFYLTDEQAMEYGLIPDTRPPYVPPKNPWRRRLRWWLFNKRETLAELLYCWISGHELPGDDWR